MFTSSFYFFGDDMASVTYSMNIQVNALDSAFNTDFSDLSAKFNIPFMTLRANPDYIEVKGILDDIRINHNSSHVLDSWRTNPPKYIENSNQTYYTPELLAMYNALDNAINIFSSKYSAYLTNTITALNVYKSVLVEKNLIISNEFVSSKGKSLPEDFPMAISGGVVLTSQGNSNINHNITTSNEPTSTITPRRANPSPTVTVTPEVYNYAVHSAGTNLHKELLLNHNIITNKFNKTSLTVKDLVYDIDSNVIYYIDKDDKYLKISNGNISSKESFDGDISSINLPEGSRRVIETRNGSTLISKEVINTRGISYKVTFPSNTVIASGGITGNITISKNILDFDVGTDHVVILDIDGKFYSQGRNEYLQLGVKNAKLDVLNSDSDYGVYKFEKVFCGSFNTFVIDNNQLLYVCGLNNSGQLGLGHFDNVEELTKVDKLEKVHKVFPYQFHTYVLTELRLSSSTSKPSQSTDSLYPRPVINDTNKGISPTNFYKVNTNPTLENIVSSCNGESSINSAFNEFYRINTERYRSLDDSIFMNSREYDDIQSYYNRLKRLRVDDILEQWKTSNNNYDNITATINNILTISNELSSKYSDFNKIDGISIITEVLEGLHLCLNAKNNAAKQIVDSDSGISGLYSNEIPSDVPSIKRFITPGPMYDSSGNIKLDNFIGKPFDLPKRKLKTWSYNIFLHYIDETKVDLASSIMDIDPLDHEKYFKPVKLDNYIMDFLYIIDYDSYITPIYSIKFNVPEKVLDDLKYRFAKLKFYLTVEKYPKNNISMIDDQFINTIKVIDSRELVAIDPDINNISSVSDAGLSNQPLYHIKLDFIMKKDILMNIAIQAKVFRNVRMIDVIVAILTDAYEKSGMKTRGEEVKFSIMPPDNNLIYPQIILDPSNVVNNLKLLQEKYGVYRTGIRIFFDSNASVKNSDLLGFLQKPTTMITVTEKGNEVPIKNSLNRVVIECEDMIQKSEAAYTLETGSEYLELQNTLVIRTTLPYKIKSRNSSKLIHGDSIRAINSSQSGHISSVCDISKDYDSMQQVYWMKNDNPFALTQLQDSIKEQEVELEIQAADIDVLTLGTNLRYFVKFLNKDDEMYSKEYRLNQVMFAFKNLNTSTEKRNVQPLAVFHFKSLVDIKINDVSAPRGGYLEKIKDSAQSLALTGLANSINIPNLTKDYFGFDVLNIGVSGLTSTKDRLKTSGPFKCNFAGQKDLNDAIIPDELTDDFMMSRFMTFGDCWKFTNGPEPRSAVGLSQNYQYFINVQMFCKKVLDVIFEKYGGKVTLDSFYKVTVTPDQGDKDSMHALGLAVDIVMESQIRPNAGLLGFFYEIVRENKLNRDYKDVNILEEFGEEDELKVPESEYITLPYDKVILNGVKYPDKQGEWKWVHIEFNTIGINKQQAYYTKDQLSSQYFKVEPRMIRRWRDMQYELVGISSQLVSKLSTP